MVTMREAAQKALSRLDGATTQSGAKISRAVIDVETAAGSELVTVVMRGDELLVSTSAPDSEGEHVRSALRLLAGEGGPVTRSSSPPPGPEVVAGSSSGQVVAHREDGVAAAIDDLATAISRLGASNAHAAPSVEEGIARLFDAVGRPAPVDLSRWIGRLRRALADSDAELLARLLYGATLVANDLRTASPSSTAIRRIVSLLGADSLPALGHVEPAIAIYDRVLIEIGRQWLFGRERAGIERRYLVDIGNGEIFREDRLRTGPSTASIGPCPRVLTVGLGEVEDTGPPRELRLRQYAVATEVTAADWSSVLSCAVASFSDLLARYRADLEVFPGLVEPFAIVAPARFSAGERAFFDADGAPLPIGRASGDSVVEAIATLTGGTAPAWVAGRVVDSAGTLVLLPSSLLVHDDQGDHFHRIA